MVKAQLLGQTGIDTKANGEIACRQAGLLPLQMGRLVGRSLPSVNSIPWNVQYGNAEILLLVVIAGIAPLTSRQSDSGSIQ
jgi:hypothetical protein